jgi:chromosome segregation ATPase
MKVLEENYNFQVDKECKLCLFSQDPWIHVNKNITGAELSKNIQMTVRGWADSVVGKKRMFLHTLDSHIEKRQAKIAKLETIEKDLEQSINNKQQQVNKLLTKVDKFKYLLDVVGDLQQDVECVEEKIEEMEAQYEKLTDIVQDTEASRDELEDTVSALQQELFTLKEKVGRIIRNM